ncbi:hypothetical protein AB0G02_06835 [Actinosynnema sp. NPDC023658]|uniref:hypothetical protein n=1 Tax=Actinosynnema sp. NPDC023658 TaxID=3155465 RepID=UPI0033DE6297
MGLTRLAVVVGALVTAGCAATAASTLSVGSDPTAPTHLPAQYAPPQPGDFPVTATPRPIVLFSPPGPASVPLPGGPATLPLIDVGAAVDAMSEGGREGPPQELVSAELSTAAYLTDRGPLELPVWKFRTAWGSDRMWPAVTPEAFWKGAEQSRMTFGATTSDGLELRVRFPEPSPPCPGEAPAVTEAVVTERPTVVEVRLRTVSGGGGTCVHAAILRGTKSYTVKLTEPLGARLLMDEEHRVVHVTKS